MDSVTVTSQLLQPRKGALIGDSGLHKPPTGVLNRGVQRRPPGMGMGPAHDHNYANMGQIRHGGIGLVLLQRERTVRLLVLSELPGQSFLWEWTCLLSNRG